MNLEAYGSGSGGVKLSPLWRNKKGLWSGERDRDHFALSRFINFVRLMGGKAIFFLFGLATFFLPWRNCSVPSVQTLYTTVCGIRHYGENRQKLFSRQN